MTALHDLPSPGLTACVDDELDELLDRASRRLDEVGRVLMPDWRTDMWLDLLKLEVGVWEPCWEVTQSGDE